jgi:hypothetical protein
MLSFLACYIRFRFEQHGRIYHLRCWVLVLGAGAGAGAQGRHVGRVHDVPNLSILQATIRQAE